MPLQETERMLIHSYCTRDLPGDIAWHIEKFKFIDNDELKTRLGRAFYSARYMSKLMEALNVSGDEIHPFIKYQIIQYASIYEAVISFLLWNKFQTHPEVIALSSHKAYKPISALSKLTNITYDGESLYTCLYKETKTPPYSIPFHDKVDCAVKIGFVDECYARDFKILYRLRNLAHIEAEAEKSIDFEIEHSKSGYWRMQPFLEKIETFLLANPIE